LSLLLPSISAWAQTLLQKSDLQYQGAFRLPAGTFGGSSFAYGGSVLAHNPANNSLYIVGHDHQQQVAEISIPTIVNDSTNRGALKTATVLQPFTEATEGKMGKISPGGTFKVGGLMVDQGKLYESVYAYYDATGSQADSHFVSGTNLSAAGDVRGPFRVGNAGAGFVSGWMIRIPQAYHASFGAPAITGNCCLSIITRTSWGPAAFAFNPADLGVKNPVPTAPLLYYNSANPTLGNCNSSGTPFNGSTEIHGAVFPEGTKTILFIGRHGTGTFCYGEGTGNRNLVGLPTPPGSVYCYDPTSSGKGVHAYPYAYQAWAYSAYDLLAVKNGRRNPWNVKPYAIWTLDLPFPHPSGVLGGVAYDPATKRIYVSAWNSDSERPLIHVLGLSGSAPP